MASSQVSERPWVGCATQAIGELLRPPREVMAGPAATAVVTEEARRGNVLPCASPMAPAARRPLSGASNSSAEAALVIGLIVA